MTSKSTLDLSEINFEEILTTDYNAIENVITVFRNKAELTIRITFRSNLKHEIKKLVINTLKKIKDNLYLEGVFSYQIEMKTRNGDALPTEKGRILNLENT